MSEVPGAVVMRQSRQERAAAMRLERDTVVLEAAIRVATREGWQWMTRALVADEAKLSRGSISNAFGGIINLKRAVARAAIQREILPILANVLAEKSPIAREIPDTLKERAAAHIAS